MESILVRLLALLAVVASALAACGDDEGPGPILSVGIRTPTPSSARTFAPSSTPPATIAPTAVETAPPTEAPQPMPKPFSGPAQVVRIGNMSRRMVAFSFDAGADVGYTTQILDTLATNGIEASFGITGRWAEQNAAQVQRIVAEGHELINHSYSHPSFTGLSTQQPALTQEDRWQQLDRTEEIVRELTGATTKPYFRPPFGDYDESANADVGARGYAYNVIWTVDSRGWTGIPAPAIVQRCLELAEPGAIYVFHVGGQSQDGPALQEIIDGLGATGYEIGSVSDALAP